MKAERIPLELPPPPPGDGSTAGRIRARDRGLWAIRQIAAGYSRKEVASALGISPRTLDALRGRFR